MVLVDKQQFTVSQLAHLTLTNDTKSIDGEFYICKACKITIKNNKIPSCNEKKIKFRIDNLPEEYLTAEMTLSKLEAHLLKLVIPFIRITAIPGYGEVKVKGPMITVEADIKKTIDERILPRQQELIPVSLKRKFTYKGNVMEEIVSKQKVITYFNYFKKENPLFAKENLDLDKIDEWIKIVLGEDYETQELMIIVKKMQKQKNLIKIVKVINLMLFKGFQN